MSSFIDALYEPERHCTCGHHEGSHCNGFSNQACMWCDCRVFEDAERVAEPTPARSAPSPHLVGQR